MLKEINQRIQELKLIARKFKEVKVLVLNRPIELFEEPRIRLNKKSKNKTLVKIEREFYN